MIEWIKSHLCLLLDHRWGQGWDQPCLDCGAPRPRLPQQ